jgi:protein-S-isoprenylcysteine O-methyltransferase Ste14
MFRLKLALRTLFTLALAAALLFGSAGRLDLPWFWAYLGLLAVFAAGAMLTLPRELLEERVAPGTGGRDNLLLLRVVFAALSAGQLTAAGLDVGRYHWSDGVPAAARALGLAAAGTMFGTWYWSMRSNAFFSAAVRIQRERGHRVVSSGPYRFVRHPGYAALVLLGWGGPLALGSWWAVTPHLVVVVWFVRRARIEDRMLHEELEGYAAYAATVRYRFIPGIW